MTNKELLSGRFAPYEIAAEFAERLARWYAGRVGLAIDRGGWIRYARAERVGAPLCQGYRALYRSIVKNGALDSELAKYQTEQQNTKETPAA